MKLYFDPTFPLTLGAIYSSRMLCVSCQVFFRYQPLRYLPSLQYSSTIVLDGSQSTKHFFKTFEVTQQQRLPEIN